jgi:hypothetical protein
MVCCLGVMLSSRKGSLYLGTLAFQLDSKQDCFDDLSEKLSDLFIKELI